ncbi:hypothetical protein D9M71_819450 [compost metagenome]
MSTSQNQPNTPSSIAGIPSTTNSTCQSRRPIQPSRCVMIQPASGPLIIPAIIAAIRNPAVMRARNAAGNQ